jgi:hypothetical protein
MQSTQTAEISIIPYVRNVTANIKILYLSLCARFCRICSSSISVKNTFRPRSVNYICVYKCLTQKRTYNFTRLRYTRYSNPQNDLQFEQQYVCLTTSVLPQRMYEYLFVIHLRPLFDNIVEDEKLFTIRHFKVRKIQSDILLNSDRTRDAWQTASVIHYSVKHWTK